MTEEQLNYFLEEEEGSGKLMEEENSRELQQAPDLTDVEEISESLFKMVSEDRQLADKTFELFYFPIAEGKDHTQASKESLMRAVELKIESSKNVLKMFEIVSKKNQAGTNINFNGFIPPKKVGINIDNIIEHIKEDN